MMDRTRKLKSLRVSKKNGNVTEWEGDTVTRFYIKDNCFHVHWKNGATFYPLESLDWVRSEYHDEN